MPINDSAIDEYNPFGPPDKRDIESGPPSQIRATIPPQAPVSQPAEIVATQEYYMSDDALRDRQKAEIDRRVAELDARAAELDRLEREQAERATKIDARGPEANNWPRIPKFCPCQPCVRQDFEADIPGSVRWMARFGYYLWMGYTVLLLFNVFGTVANFVVKGSSDASALLGTSILIAILMPPIAFIAWHRQLYKALKKNSSLNFLIFFIAFSVQAVIILIQVLGIDYLGACGWINGLMACNTHKGVCGFMLVLASVFTIAAVASAYLIISVYRFYRSSGIRHVKLPTEETAAVLATAAKLSSHQN